MGTSRSDIILPHIDELSDKDFELTLAFIAALKGDLKTEFARELLRGDNPYADVPKWEDRTTGREVTPVDWIQKYYGKIVDGVWDPDGLTLADLSRNDRKLYDAYVARIRRLPQEDLGLPSIPKPRITDAEQHLAERRLKRRKMYNKDKLKRAPS